MNKIEMKRMPLGVFVRMQVARFMECLSLIRSDMDRNVPHAYRSRDDNRVLLTVGDAGGDWYRIPDREPIRAAVSPMKGLGPHFPRYGQCVEVINGRWFVVRAPARYWADANPGVCIREE
jgi:hypothetical protein